MLLTPLSTEWSIMSKPTQSHFDLNWIKIVYALSKWSPRAQMTLVKWISAICIRWTDELMPKCTSFIFLFFFFVFGDFIGITSPAPYSTFQIVCDECENERANNRYHRHSFYALVSKSLFSYVFSLSAVSHRKWWGRCCTTENICEKSKRLFAVCASTVVKQSFCPALVHFVFVFLSPSCLLWR